MVNLMNLEAALNAFRAEFLETFPTEKAAIMQQTTDIPQKFTANRAIAQPTRLGV